MFKYRVDENIELRIFEYVHTEELFKLIDRNRDYLKKWFVWVDRANNISGVNDFIKYTKNSLANGQGVKAGIWYKSNLVGLIDHHNVNKSAKSLNIGYWLDSEFQGHGIVTKSCISMVNYAFDIGMNKVEIRCADKNLSSRGIPERLGFKEEGKIRCAEYLYDHYVDHVVYGILRNEWIS